MTEEPGNPFDERLDDSNEPVIEIDPESQEEVTREEPFFDIDTDIRPDTDSNIFNRRPEYAQDDYGEYGSFFDTKEDSEPPTEP